MTHVRGGGIQKPKGNYKPENPPVVSQNVRVKLPENEDEEDDMSMVDPEAELAEEEIERMKIKHQDEMRYTKSQKFNV